MRRCVVHDLESISFDDAYALQRQSVEKLQCSHGDDVFYLLEHPHVVTMGRNATGAALKNGDNLLAKRNVTLVETDRGGDVTYHGPGQLVGYPILMLESERRDIRRYVRDVEEVLIRTLAEFSIDARRDTVHRGVWIDERKIASVGIRISRWVTSHGFALNVNTDLSYFSLIVPCGIEGCQMTSMARELGGNIDMRAVKDTVVRVFSDVFDRQLVHAEIAEGARHA